MAQQNLAIGVPVDPLELDSSRPATPTELEDRLHECREEFDEAKVELEEMLKSCGEWAQSCSTPMAGVAGEN